MNGDENAASFRYQDSALTLCSEAPSPRALTRTPATSTRARCTWTPCRHASAAIWRKRGDLLGASRPPHFCTDMVRAIAGDESAASLTLCDIKTVL